jgi:hypothetical protein
MPQPQHAADFIQQSRWPLIGLAVCYTLVSADVIHYTHKIATLYGRMPFMVTLRHRLSACCSVGKMLDSLNSEADSTEQHHENEI